MARKSFIIRRKTGHKFNVLDVRRTLENWCADNIEEDPEGKWVKANFHREYLGEIRKELKLFRNITATIEKLMWYHKYLVY